VRTLIDLLNNELGYARIFADRDGYGYELTTYRPRTIADLFERMSGYPSAEVALTFAQQQLESIAQAPVIQSKRRTTKRPDTIRRETQRCDTKSSRKKSRS
jgi:hypothetical protein